MRWTEEAGVEEERAEDDKVVGGAGEGVCGLLEEDKEAAGTGVAASRRVLRRGAILEMKSSSSVEERKTI